MRVRTASRILAGLIVSLEIGALVLGRPARVSGQQTGADHAGHAHGSEVMSDAAMKRWAEQWWATHPAVGATTAQPAAATFQVSNFIFNADNNVNTQVDQVTISVGESVTWQWLAGFHTITNGNGFEDPQAGTLFDQPSDNTHTSFSFVFNTIGTYPFFCRPHEGIAMTGIINVTAATGGVDPATGAPLGFTAGPSPRPSRAGVSFGFALRSPGRVRAEIFDAGGRRVATVIDRAYAAGPHTGAWNGRSDAGAAASTGMYFLRLRLPGYDGSRAVVITR